jgi:adenine deaminase
MKIKGRLVDIFERSIYPAIISIVDGKINDIKKTQDSPSIYIIPGLIDSHIHIESSMITPGAFASEAVKHGTVAVVSDPHEIANVLGLDGVMFMLRDAEKVPVKFFFGAPSCVPATIFESSGAVIDHNKVKELLKLPDINYLSEMMNFPGVLNNDKEVHKKLGVARKLGKPIDGHAPGLNGDSLRKYINSGILTDHECSTFAEAEEKIKLGMKVLIREGSAARNLNSLKPLFSTQPDMIMLCSDDLHPEMLMRRHLEKLIAELFLEGYDIFDILRSVTLNPSQHYNLNAGLLRQGDKADFILVDSLEKMNVLQTWIDGKMVFGEGQIHFNYLSEEPVNNFNSSTVLEEEIRVINAGNIVRAIEAYDGELVTGEILFKSGTSDYIESNPENDILKIVVKDRYNDSPPATGFIKGFGIKRGAFASSVAHDSHNIIAVGTNDSDIISAINEIVRLKGGLAVSCSQEVASIQLNIAGIMTNRSCTDVANDYEKLNKLLNSYGCIMKAPFMTLSFMALLVIPDLKISDRGLFDVRKFDLVSMFV